MKLFANTTFLTLILSIGIVLTGCGSSSDYSDSTGETVDLLTKSKPTNIHGDYPAEKVIKFWTFHQAQEFEFMESLAVHYQLNNPGVEIKVEYVQLDDYFGTKLISSFATGQGPDIFLVSPGTIKKFAEADILYSLNSRFTPEIKSDFYQGALESVTVDEEIMAIPFEIELLGLYYNKQMFKDKGISPPRTWDDMAQAAASLRTNEVSGLTIETAGSFYQNFTWLPFLWQTGADIVDDNTNRSQLNQANAIKMYSFFQEMRSNQLLNLYPSRPTNDIGILANGETAMQVAGTWNIRLLESTFQDVPIGVVPLPIPEGGRPATISGGWKVGVNRHSAHLDEAARFVMWAFAEDIKHPLQWCTEIKFAYSPRKSVMLASEDFNRKGLREVFTDKILHTAIPEPSLSDEINRIFTESLQNILYNHYDGEKAAQEASQKINDYLK